MTCVGLFGGTDDANAAAGLVGGGAVATLFGVSMFSPRLVRPLASICGWPLEKLQRHHRAPGARERGAQAGPHRGHRGAR